MFRTHTYRSLAPVFALLMSFSILCLGHGLQSVLLPARAVLEHYSDMQLGILSSSYFLGFITGTFTAPSLISRVGHVHVFAASAAGAAAAMISFPLFDGVAAWVLLRFLYGICLVQFYTVMESWLNSISTDTTRGKILSCYMILHFIAMSGGQMLFSSTDIGSYQLFSIAAVLLCLSLIPLLLSRIRKPDEVSSAETFGLRKLYRASPLGTIGALVFGLISGVFWALTAPYVLQLGFSQTHIAWFIAATMLGGLIGQWPLGALSDRISRRVVIAIAATLVAASAGLLTQAGLAPSPAADIGTGGLLVYGMLFGIGFHPFYSLCIAHTNDFVPNHLFVRSCATLQLTQSSGAIAGSLLAGWWVQQFGILLLYSLISGLAGFLALYALLRITGRRVPKYVSPFRILTRTGTGAFYLDPRA